RRRSVVAAAREVGVSRARAVYRLARLRQRAGGPMVNARRGGASGGGSGLTARGRAVLSAGAEAASWPSDGVPPRHQGFRGVFHLEPEPHVEASDGFSAAVAFVAEDGAPVAVTIDPEAIVVAVGAVRSSARNAWDGVVERVRSPKGGGPSGRRELTVRVGRRRILVALTARSVESLELAPGRAVTLLAKATAVRPVGLTRGFRRA
ncbi:MAG: TOBE domain-containing protein, partial [Thermoplasmata archaeon]|nr:TOBE domain-containing protein [Thermoplasmata archaeon]